MERRKTPYNRIYNKLAALRLNKALSLTFNFIFDSLRFRNRQLLVAAKR
jgi:hypothetical protein